VRLNCLDNLIAFLMGTIHSQLQVSRSHPKEKLEDGLFFFCRKKPVTELLCTFFFFRRVNLNLVGWFVNALANGLVVWCSKTPIAGGSFKLVSCPRLFECRKHSGGLTLA
jgi:hypothetical protein